MHYEIPAADFDDVSNAVADLSATVARAVQQLQMLDIAEPFAEVLLHLRRPLMPEPEGVTASQNVVCNSKSLVEQAIARIESHEHQSLAWVRLDKAEAVQRAGALDEQLAGGKPLGLLHGVPVGLKDMFERRGQVAGWGSVIRAGAPVADRDATVVARLEQAGAVLLGALHMAEFAMSPTGLNEHLGHGSNPHSPAHVSGGSSSGAGMVVGAGDVSLAIGSDTGGSVRLPAALCGVTGLKPTQFRVSAFGAMPLSPSLDCIGPLASNADLCGNALVAMAGADPLDLSCVDLPLRAGSWRGRKAHAFTVAVPRLQAGEFLSAEMLATFKRAREALASAGMHCVEIDLPDLELYGKLASVLLAVESAAIHREYLTHRPDIFGRQVRRRLSRGLLMPGLDYLDAQRLRAPLLRTFMREALGKADALLLPTSPAGAPRIVDTTHGDQLQLERDFSRLSYWTRGINYLGVPALSIPAGVDGFGLPLGVQFVGAPFDEERLLAIGCVAQSLPDWPAQNFPGI